MRLQNLTGMVALLVLALGFIQAPFSHIHAGGHSHPVDSFFHLHADAPESARLSAPPEEAAIYLDWGATPQTHLEFTLPDGAADLLVPPSRTSGPAFVVTMDRVHSPPQLRALPPRAPPV